MEKTIEEPLDDSESWLAGGLLGERREKRVEKGGVQGLTGGLMESLSFSS